jgi:hypothetical protein
MCHTANQDARQQALESADNIQTKSPLGPSQQVAALKAPEQPTPGLNKTSIANTCTKHSRLHACIKFTHKLQAHFLLTVLIAKCASAAARGTDRGFQLGAVAPPADYLYSLNWCLIHRSSGLMLSHLMT